MTDPGYYWVIGYFVVGICLAFIHLITEDKVKAGLLLSITVAWFFWFMMFVIIWASDLLNKDIRNPFKHKGKR